MKRLLLLGLMILLTACAVPEVSTPAPTPEAIQVIYTASLKYWTDKIAGCAASNPLIALYFHQSPTLYTHNVTNVISLELGEPSLIDNGSYLSQVGNEQIVVIFNQDNDLTQLSTDKLQSIYSGQTSSWDNGTGQPIQVWVFPEGDPVRTIFDRVVLKSYTLTTQAMLAPDPGAMLEAISSDSNAIGYLANSILSSSDPTLSTKVKLIQLDTSLQEEFHQPVLAITLGEPEGVMRELLVCLQSDIP